MSTGAPVVPSKPKTSGLAIASLILGIMASKKIKASGGTVGGRGLATAGIIISIVTLILGLVLAVALVYYDLTGAKDMATQVQCQNNLKLLCVVTWQYANKNKLALPPVNTWPEVFLKKENLLENDDISCPGKGGAGRTYAMNAKLNGVRHGEIRRPVQTVMFFECSPGTPPSGIASDLPSEPPHTSGWPIAFCDGHVELVPPHRLDRIVWDPKAE
jgi:prepilin-type processing-associated H-X9-DG protein